MPENALFLCEQIKACETQAMQLYARDASALMSEAGMEAFLFLQQLVPNVRRIAVFCGSGNNAGDGYVVARLAYEHGYSVTVYQCGAVERLPEAAQKAALLALNTGVECLTADDPLDPDIELIIDALIGTGLKGSIHGTIATAIHQINASRVPVLALDVPSGLNADTGAVADIAVCATTTLTFIARKVGLFTGDGPDYCGTVYCASLKLDALVAQMRPHAVLLGDENRLLPLVARKKNTHKGDYGHILLIGGGPGMPGALSLAAKAAMRSGAGAVSIATRPEYAQSALPYIPEAMVFGVTTAEELAPLLAKATVCIIGPGLGESDWAQALFLAAITAQLPMIIDASALRLLAHQPQVDDNWVLTPHPGEAAALLASTAREVQSNRCEAVAAIQQHYGGVVVLKGTGTVIRTDEQHTFICPRGNPGMASAGMGDVLSGIIAGLCAQGLSLAEAAKLGVWVHAAAGDKAASLLGEASLLASDVLDMIPLILHDKSHGS